MAKRRRSWEKIILWPLFGIAFIGGLVLGTNQNFRATVLMQKFVTFNYPSCKTTCMVEFYRGSKIASYSPPVVPGARPLPSSVDLISPTFEGKNNINMRIEVGNSANADTAAGKELLATYGNCSGEDAKKVFSEDLTNLGTTANVCAVSSKVGNHNYVVGYYSVFDSQKTGSFDVVGLNENVEFNAKGEVSNQLIDLSKYEKDVEDILASIQVKH